jgi:RNA polymerase sigma-70 factor (ECF subfamily)
MSTKQDRLADKYDECVRYHFDMVYQIALMRSGDHSLAEDITQEVFIRIYKGLSHFREDSQLSTWIYRITMNVCHTYLKKESQHQLKQTLVEVGDFLHQTKSHSPEEVLMKKSRQEEVWAAIQSLTPIQADVITLYYLKEYDYSEISDILKMPMGTLKSHLHRAKKALKQYFQKEEL